MIARAFGFTLWSPFAGLFEIFRVAETMIQFRNALAAWGTDRFDEALKAEIRSLDARQLPLQEALSFSSSVLDDRPEVMILRTEESGSIVRVRAGLFYAGVIAGCNCADDPTPMEELREFCRVLFEIDKHTAQVTISLLSD